MAGRKRAADSERPAEAGRSSKLGKTDENRSPGLARDIVAPPEGIEPSLPGLRDLGPASTGGGVRRLRGAATLFALLAACALLAPASAAASFGFSSFSVAAEKQGGEPVTQAGSHPYRLETDVSLNTIGGASDGDLRDLTVHLPPGLLINPTALSECSSTAFHTHRTSTHETSESGENCPNSTQVGVIGVKVGGKAGGEERHFGLFNLVPPFGDAAAIGASPFGAPLVFVSKLRESDSGLDLVLDSVPQSFDLQSLKLTIWGTPWEAAHDVQRGNCLDEETGGSFNSCGVYGGEGTGAIHAPESQIHSYLTMPTTPCDQPLPFTAAARSWQGAEAADSAETSTLKGICHESKEVAQLQLMTANAAQGTGLVFNLGVSDGGGILNPGGEALPAIETAIAALPEGLTINPSLGAGLRVCTEAQWAEETAGSAAGAGCPAGSKIGNTRLEGTLGLSENLTGSVFLAQPYANPFHSLLAVYMLARLPRRGLIVKSAGKIEPAAGTGRLTATFDELPRLLYTHFIFSLREGQRAALVSPNACGGYPTEFSLADYAHPSEFRSEQTSFFIQHGEGGGSCPAGGIPPFHPGLLAGSLNPQAAAYTPFYLRMTRTDSEQEITSYSATFPPGLLAKIAGVADCPDAAIEAAKAMSGAAEQEHPSCPESSKIGRTMAGYGLGGTLAWAPGNLYLAGPYHGAPLSVVAIDSALVGPFDLGTVVVRSAIRIDPQTAQASVDSAGSDPIPHILAGIPLHLRDIRVYLDRPGFTVNGTSCDPTRVSSLLGGAGADPFNPADDTTATSSQRYQLLNCSVLDFKPRLSIKLGGGTKRGAFPALHATYAPRPGDANLKQVAVTLPPSLFLEQGHIRTVCTRAQFRNEACSSASVYGRARAITPLMEGPLEGPVYLRSSSHALPDLVADLHGRGIRIEVVGRIDSAHEGIRATFEGLPDAPVTKFTMSLPGGRHGLLAVAAPNLCASPQRANARFIAQSNATEMLHPALRVRCGAHRHRH